MVQGPRQRLELRTPKGKQTTLRRIHQRHLVLDRVEWKHQGILYKPDKSYREARTARIGNQVDTHPTRGRLQANREGSCDR